MQTKFVEANGLRFEVLEQVTGVRLALCLHGFPEHAISWRHQTPVLAGMGYRVWAVDAAKVAPYHDNMKLCPGQNRSLYDRDPEPRHRSVNPPRSRNTDRVFSAFHLR